MQQIEKQHRKGFNSLVVLVAWWIWKHRNACVFEGASPNVNALVQEIRDEANLWCMAEAKGLRSLVEVFLPSWLITHVNSSPNGLVLCFESS